ncbi:MAG: phytase, partial [Chloroflexi bacterium]|nr:phytase [Chloroflexota bacterium]
MHLVKARQQLGDGGLAAAGGANEGDGRASRDAQVEVAEDGVALDVGELDVFEDEIAAAVGHGPGVRRPGDRGALAEDVPDARGGGHGALAGGYQLAEALDREDEHVQVLEEGDELAGGELAFEDEIAAEAEDDELAEGGQPGEEGRVDRAQTCRLHAVVEGAIGDRLELADFVVFAAEGADGAHAGDVLFDDVGDVGKVLLNTSGSGREAAEEAGAEQGDDGIGEHGGEGERDVDGEEDGECADGDEEERGVEGDDDGEHLDLVQVGAGAGHELAGGRAVVVVEGELVYLVVELGAEVGLDAVAGAHGEVAADGGGETLDGGDADDAAIWVHPTDRARSTIIGTDKLGGLVVYDLAGKEIQSLPDGDLNNVDLRHDFPLGGESVALVTAADSTTHRLAIYRV